MPYSRRDLEMENDGIGRENEESESAENAKNEEIINDEDLDESLAERLWGLTEMFPSWLRNGTLSLSTFSVAGIKTFYSFSRSALWIVFSSSVILMAPVIFEVERAQMEELQKQQQRQILLGPNAAVAGNQPHFPIPMPHSPSQSR